MKHNEEVRLEVEELLISHQQRAFTRCMNQLNGIVVKNFSSTPVPGDMPDKSEEES